MVTKIYKTSQTSDDFINHCYTCQHLKSTKQGHLGRKNRFTLLKKQNKTGLKILEVASGNQFFQNIGTLPSKQG